MYLYKSLLLLNCGAHESVLAVYASNNNIEINKHPSNTRIQINDLIINMIEIKEIIFKWTINCENNTSFNCNTNNKKYYSIARSTCIQINICTDLKC